MLNAGISISALVEVMVVVEPEMLKVGGAALHDDGDDGNRENAIMSAA